MIYEIIVSEKAKIDMKNIYEYIANELCVPEIGKNIISLMLDKIDNLCEMPERNPIYSREPLYSKGVRFLLVGRYIVFYKVEKEQGRVHVARIIYNGRNIETQLKDIE